ncbi:LppU/SCO3897 family protein [Streptomyces sp. NPDC002913]
MSLPEITLSLTPRQAADGAVVTVPLPTGDARIRIPPTTDGDLVRAQVDGREVILRIRVSGPSNAVRWLAVLGVAAAFVVAVVLLNGVDDASSDVATPSSGSSAYASDNPFSQDPYTEDPYTEDPSTADPYTEEPSAEETDDTEEPYTEDPYTEDPYDTGAEEPDPYESGTCLNGTLPDSTTAQEVSDVDEVSCSASDAHYQVIQTIPGTSDMSSCNSNSRTQYAFSYRYTLNGATLNEYVYCLVGLGSYAR